MYVIRAKKVRKTIMLEEKVKMIKLSEEGVSNSEIGRRLNFARTTVITVLKNKQKIMDEVKRATPVNTAIIRKRDGLIADMEALLVVWIHDQTSRRVAVNMPIIQTRALSLFKDMKAKKGEDAKDAEFAASRGWFEKFKRRANLHNIHLQGEATGANLEAAESFSQNLAKEIEEEGYTKDQIFNVDETRLFWKRMPHRTFIAKGEKSLTGFKPGKDRLTLLLGVNASGNLKLKPMLVYHSENPIALKNYIKSSLPVIWKSNLKAWVTASIFEDWFNDYFAPTVEKYCNDNELPFKILLLLENAPGRPQMLDYISSNIRVLFFPPNTVSLLQPMDQLVTDAFKHYYLKQIFDKCITFIGNEEGIRRDIIKKFWKEFTILDGIKSIRDAWNDVTITTLKGAWTKLIPQLLDDFEGSEDPLPEATENIVEMAKQLQLEVEPEDVTKLIKSHSEPLSNEDLMALAEQRQGEEVPVVESKGLTLKVLAEVMSYQQAIMSLIEKHDTDFERSSKVNSNLSMDLACYMEIYREKKILAASQTTFGSYFRKRLASSISFESEAEESSENGLSSSTKASVSSYDSFQVMTPAEPDLNPLFNEHITETGRYSCENMNHETETTQVKLEGDYECSRSVDMDVHQSVKLEPEDEMPAVQKDEGEDYMSPAMDLSKVSTKTHTQPIEDHLPYSEVKHEESCPEHGPRNYVNSAETKQGESLATDLCSHVNRDDKLDIKKTEPASICRTNQDIPPRSKQSSTFSRFECLKMQKKITSDAKYLGSSKDDDPSDMSPEDSCVAGDSSSVETTRDSTPESRMAFSRLECLKMQKKVMHRGYSKEDQPSEWLQQDNVNVVTFDREDARDETTEARMAVNLSYVASIGLQDSTDDVCETVSYCTQNSVDAESVENSHFSEQKGMHAGDRSSTSSSPVADTSSPKSSKKRYTSIEEKPYKCEDCGVGFASSRCLKTHKITHTGEKPYSCDLCGACYAHDSSLKAHKITHTGEKPYKCDVCGACFANSCNLKRHKRRHSEEKPYKCDTCSAEFTDPRYLKNHIVRHTEEKSFKCDLCGVAFYNACNLKRHVRIHTGEKPYKCDVCDLEFADNRHLKTHKIKHTGERPFCCDICGVGFVDARYLKVHKVKHTGEKPYKCDVCGEAFAYYSTVTTHKRIHTGEKPYKCDICGAAFAHYSTAKTHRRIHTGEKPYRCDFCDVAFAHHSHLKSHRVKHTGEKPFKCDVCGVSFALLRTLKTHQKIYNEQKPLET